METAQPLHPEAKALVDRIAQLNAKPYYELASVDEARARSKLVSTHEAVAGRVQYDGTRKELFVPLPDFTGTTANVSFPDVSIKPQCKCSLLLTFWHRWALQIQIQMVPLRFLASRRYASAAVAMALCLRLSVTSRCSIDMDGRIELVSGMYSFF